jgi:hypothetical protein
MKREASGERDLITAGMVVQRFDFSATTADCVRVVEEFAIDFRFYFA